MLSGAQPFIFIIFFALPMMLLKSFVCLYLHSSLNRIPPAYRKISPLMSWVLVFPCVAQLFNFYYWPKFSASYRAYFESAGQNMGSCGLGLGILYSIVSFITSLFDTVIAIKDYGLPWTCALVAMLVLLFKAGRLRKAASALAEQGSTLPQSDLSSAAPNTETQVPKQNINPWLAGGLIMSISVAVLLIVITAVAIFILIMLLKGLGAAR